MSQPVADRIFEMFANRARQFGGAIVHSPTDIHEGNSYVRVAVDASSPRLWGFETDELATGFAASLRPLAPVVGQIMSVTILDSDGAKLALSLRPE